MTEEMIQLATRVKALEADVDTLQRKMAALLRIAEKLANDVTYLKGSR